MVGVLEYEGALDLKYGYIEVMQTYKEILRLFKKNFHFILYKHERLILL